jgi:rare lipoprotein A
MKVHSETFQSPMDRSFHAATTLTLSMILLLLGGCAGQGSRDSDRSSDYQRLTPGEIPDAVPKVEPMAKYGNMASYSVDGKLYYTKQDARGHVERGKASWYGTKFNGRRTSSGELYDMYAMSAAHKTLPLPCYVRITNLDNGRSAVVRINDRGPFHSNRVIDLSYAAATKIGVFPKGTAMVEVRGIDPAQPDSASGVTPAVPRRSPRPDNSPFFAESSANTEQPYQTDQYQPNDQAIAQSLTIASRGTVPRQRFRSSRPVDSWESERVAAAAFDTVKAAPMPVSAPKSGATASPKTAEEDASPALVARGPDLGHETTAPGGGQGLYLQIGAFGDPRNAERLRQRLSPELAAQVRIQQPGEGASSLYKVRIGPLGSEGEARRLSAQISTLGLSEQPRLIWN